MNTSVSRENLVKKAQIAVISLLLVLLGFGLTGCQDNQASSSSSESEETTSEATSDYTQEEIRQTLEEALAGEVNNVSFKMDSTTKTNSVTSSGAQQSSTKTTMSGELDQSGETERFHVFMSVTNSTSSSGNTAFEIYKVGSDVYIVQDGQTYVGNENDLGLGNYTEAITSIISSEGGSGILEAASDLKMEKRENETAITIISDPSKLSGDEVADGNTDSVSAANVLSSLVTVYTINSEGRVTQVMMTGGTTGTPSYHIRQTYTFWDYNATTVPDAPEPTAMSTGALMTDEQGRQYLEEGGVRYYLADDGLFYAEQ